MVSLDLHSSPILQTMAPSLREAQSHKPWSRTGIQPCPTAETLNITSVWWKGPKSWVGVVASSSSRFWPLHASVYLQEETRLQVEMGPCPTHMGRAWPVPERTLPWLTLCMEPRGRSRAVARLGHILGLQPWSNLDYQPDLISAPFALRPQNNNLTFSESWERPHTQGAPEGTAPKMAARGTVTWAQVEWSLRWEVLASECVLLVVSHCAGASYTWSTIVIYASCS